MYIHKHYKHIYMYGWINSFVTSTNIITKKPFIIWLLWSNKIQQSGASFMSLHHLISMYAASFDRTRWSHRAAHLGVPIYGGYFNVDVKQRHIQLLMPYLTFDVPLAECLCTSPGSSDPDSSDDLVTRRRPPLLAFPLSLRFVLVTLLEGLSKQFHTEDNLILRTD